LDSALFNIKEYAQAKTATKSRVRIALNSIGIFNFSIASSNASLLYEIKSEIEAPAKIEDKKKIIGTESLQGPICIPVSKKP
jgi:hypothetical protein